MSSLNGFKSMACFASSSRRTASTHALSSARLQQERAELSACVDAVRRELEAKLATSEEQRTMLLEKVSHMR